VTNGILAGLVGITAGAHVVDPYIAFIVGCISAIIYELSCKLLERLEIDDPIECISIHGMTGAWGLLIVGIFDKESGLFYSGSLKLFGI